MSKNRSFWDNPFGGIFDFNHDGKEDFREQFIGYKIFEECTKNDEDKDDSDDLDLITEKDYSWRDEFEDDYVLGIYPDNYETEEEYLEALNEAKYGWRVYCEDGFQYGVDPDDYETEDEYNAALEQASMLVGHSNIELSVSFECPELDELEKIKESDYKNKRRYNAAYTLADEFTCYTDEEYEKREKSRCEFILDNADTIIAANYCTHNYGFIYAQAVKDNFSLPVSLPDEDETPEYSIVEIIKKISKKDIDLALQVWKWLVENFLPYANYTEDGEEQLTFHIIDSLYDFSDSFKIALVRYFNDNSDFCDKIMSAHKEVAEYLSELVCVCIKEAFFELAVRLFEFGIKQANGDWKQINSLTSDTISYCKTYTELETMEYFKNHIFSLVKAVELGMVQDEVEDWEKEIDEYISYIEDNCEQYAFTRKNEWRAKAEDGSAYGLDPCWYDSEVEYVAELNERKYGWRKHYEDRDTLGLSVDDFETQDEFLKVFSARMNVERQKERERIRKQESERFNNQETSEDKNIYTLCGVSFLHTSHTYYYKTGDLTVSIGDTVVVPIGDKESKGKVVAVGQYTRQAAPFPIDKTKTVISKE